MPTMDIEKTGHDFAAGYAGPVRAPRGTDIKAANWLLEAPRRMLLNNLDPEVAENPDELVVYGGRGKAARDWAAFDAIVASLRGLEADETLLVQSGKPVGVVRTTPDAPRVIIANSTLVPHWGILGMLINVKTNPFFAKYSYQQVDM